MWSNIDSDRVRRLKGKKGMTLENIECERRRRERAKKWLDDFMKGG